MTLVKTTNGSDDSDGGLDFDFVDLVHEKFTCSICHLVYRDPHLTVCCGHHFCCSCLTRWLKGHGASSSCPNCRTEGFVHVQNKEKSREVNDLRVHCPNLFLGCEEILHVSDVDNHVKLSSGCEYERVKCRNSKCLKRMLRKFEEKHAKQECDCRPYTCKYCGLRDSYAAIVGKDRDEIHEDKSHYSICPDYPVSCVNKCGAHDIKRKVMSDHRSTCQLEPVDCPFKDTGCSKKILRKYMKEHMTEKQQDHMLHLLATVQCMEKSNRGLQESNLQLLESNQELLKTSEDFRKYQNIRDCKMLDHIRSFKRNIERECRAFLTVRSVNRVLNQMEQGIRDGVALRRFRDTLFFSIKDISHLDEDDEWKSTPFVVADRVSLQLSLCKKQLGSFVQLSIHLICCEVLDYLSLLSQESDDELSFDLQVDLNHLHNAVPLVFCTYNDRSNEDECSTSTSSVSNSDISDTDSLFKRTRKRRRARDYMAALSKKPSCGYTIPFSELTNPDCLSDYGEGLFLTRDEFKALIDPLNDSLSLKVTLLKHDHYC